jgi:hypothetical protein
MDALCQKLHISVCPISRTHCKIFIEKIIIKNSKMHFMFIFWKTCGSENLETKVKKQAEIFMFWR